MQMATSGPSAAEYCRYGISARGLGWMLRTKFRDCPISVGNVCTSDICHAFLKPETVPAGWRCLPKVTSDSDLSLSEDGEVRRKYIQEYIEEATGRRQNGLPPAGTRCYCELLAEGGGAAAEFVGRPTVFLSHAWRFRFADVVAAAEAFAAKKAAAGETEEVFFWFDIFSIDQHKAGNWPVEWWFTTFKEAIRMIGQTVMVLAPWNDPIPLGRAWCLWEMFCSIDTGTAFEICLGQRERAAFEAALLQDDAAVPGAFAQIDVATAECSNPAVKGKILAAVERSGGCETLNAVVTAGAHG